MGDETPLQQTRQFASSHGHWLLRIGFASVFLFHGINKLPDPTGFAEAMGLPAALGIWVALAEVAAGAFILLGGLPLPYVDVATRVGGLFGALVMVGAVTRVHWGQWSFVPNDGFPMGGMEFQVLLGLLGLYFAAVGNPAQVIADAGSSTGSTDSAETA